LSLNLLNYIKNLLPSQEETVKYPSKDCQWRSPKTYMLHFLYLGQ